VSRKKKLCKRCFWQIFRKTVQEIGEKRRAVGEYVTEGLPRGY
jgi:hypothetical protein